MLLVPPCGLLQRYLRRREEGGGGISSFPPSVYIITSNMNLVRYYQLMELLTLALSPTWLMLLLDRVENLLNFIHMDLFPSHWSWISLSLY